jgi:hypothetical protein
MLITKLLSSSDMAWLGPLIAIFEDEFRLSLLWPETRLGLELLKGLLEIPKRSLLAGSNKRGPINLAQVLFILLNTVIVIPAFHIFSELLGFKILIMITELKISYQRWLRVNFFLFFLNLCLRL